MTIHPHTGPARCVHVPLGTACSFVGPANHAPKSEKYKLLYHVNQTSTTVFFSVYEYFLNILPTTTAARVCTVQPAELCTLALSLLAACNDNPHQCLIMHNNVKMTCPTIQSGIDDDHHSILRLKQF